MISSMGGNDTGDVVDGNVTSKARDVDDNGGMTCGAEVSRGGVDYAGGMKVYEGGVEYSCGMEVSRGGVECSRGMEISEGGMEVSLVEPSGQPKPHSPA